jgi:hypothetical protein
VPSILIPMIRTIWAGPWMWPRGALPPSICDRVGSIGSGASRGIALPRGSTERI